jgi:hypothetical protein
MTVILLLTVIVFGFMLPIVINVIGRWRGAALSLAMRQAMGQARLRDLPA